MPVRSRLWPRVWSWFKSVGWASAGSPARQRRRRQNRRLFDRRWFTFESLEAKQLLAGDIQLTEFGATGAHFVVSYEIADNTVFSLAPEAGPISPSVAPPTSPTAAVWDEVTSGFNISIYRSYDGVTLDGLVGGRQLTDAAALLAGKHTVGIAADFGDVREDYQLIAVADRRNTVVETSEDNNRIGFSGGIFRSTDGVVHVHGTGGADTVTVREKGSDLADKNDTKLSTITVSLNGWEMDFPADSVNEVHARLHGGDDVFKTHGVVTKNLHAFGGAGDDRLFTSAGNDSLLGGPGNDTLSAGAGRDLLVGEDGDDAMHGGSGPDSLFGMLGNDRLLGGRDKDVLDGGEGDDLLNAGADDDKSRGKQGADRFIAPGKNEVEDQEALDTLDLAAASEDLAAESLVFGDLSAGEELSASTMSASSSGYGYGGYGTVWLDYGGAWLPEQSSWNAHAFTVRREWWATGTSLYVFYNASGTAWYGSTNDYTINGAYTAYFSASQAESWIYVNVRDDAYEEYDETITVTLQPYPTYTLSSPTTATAWIIDNEQPWGDLDVIENGVALPESAEEPPGRSLLVGGPPAQIRISDLAYPLDWYVWDYSGQFVISQSPDMSNPIAKGSTVGAGTYYVRSNSPGLQWVGLNFDSRPSGYWWYIDWAYFTVRYPRFSVELRDGASSLYLPEDNTVDEHVFTVRRNPEDVGVAVTVNYTVGGTAASGVDYTALSGSVSFAANELTKEIRVTTLSDTIFEGNETLTVTLSSSSSYEVTGGSATANIVEVDLDVIDAFGGELAENKELLPGGFVGVNIDDDDGDGVFDGDDPIVTGGDDDLVPLLIHKTTVSGTPSHFKLNFLSQKLRIWKNSNRTEQVTSGVTTFADNADHTVYVEGHGTPNGPSIEPVTLEWQPPNGSTSRPTDKVNISVLKLELLTRDEVSGEVYQPDILYPTDPKPEVSLDLVGWQIDDYGKLHVTVRGNVSDRLSELADNAADRVQRLDFFVNRETAGTINNLASLATGPGTLPWRPYTFQHSFERTFTFDHPGRTYVIRAETSPNAAGSKGWDQITVVGGYDRIAFPLPEVSAVGQPLTIRFSAQPSSAAVDAGHVYFGDREPIVGDRTITESTVGSLDFGGELNWPGVTQPVRVRIQLAPTSTFSAAVVDQFEAVVGLDMPDGRQTAVRATFRESAANSLRFVQVGAFYPEAPDQGEGIGGWWYYDPTVHYVDHDDGSTPGNFEPFLARVDGLDESTESATTTEFDGEMHDLVPFTYSPKRFYVADRPSQGERPRIYVVTVKNLPASLEHIRAGDIDIGRNGGGLTATVRAGRAKLDAKVTVIGEDPEAVGTSSQAPSGPVTISQLLLWFDFLYGEKGAALYHHFRHNADTGGDSENYITLGDVAGDLDIDGWWDGDLEIEIEEDITPMEAAQLLFVGLERASAYYWGRIPDDAKFHINQEARRQVAAAAGAAVGPLVECYLAGISLANEGIDWVMTVSDIADGQYHAAVGFLPFVPSSAFRGTGQLLFKLPNGQRLMNVTAPIVDAFRRAESKTRLADKWAEIQHLDLDLVERKMLVEGGLLPAPTTRISGDTFALSVPRPAGFKKPQCHHNLWFARREWFAAHGLDVNDTAYLRWVEGTPVGGTPGKWQYHQDWHRDFERDWDAFIDAESVNAPYSQAQILSQMNLLQARYPAKGRASP